MHVNPLLLIFLVFCRIGSLEMIGAAPKLLDAVFCRIGSLEKFLLHGGRYIEVFCRIGSLERFAGIRPVSSFVFCRIGSLERHETGMVRRISVFCRIGSLENDAHPRLPAGRVFCRIGSLETAQPWSRPTPPRFLPHRQLRKWASPGAAALSRFLPHRQLRTCSQSVRGRKQRGLGWAARPACGLRLTVHPGSRSCAPHGQIMNRF